MEVKFIGKSFKTQVWKTQDSKRDYTVIKNRKFSIGIWDRIESVVTSKGEWICDVDSKCFKENFIII